jgi:hypothetical protein
MMYGTFQMLLSKNYLKYMCEFISGISIMFHWFICLFLCQLHIVFGKSNTYNFVHSEGFLGCFMNFRILF